MLNQHKNDQLTYKVRMYRAPTTVSVPPLRGNGVRTFRKRRKSVKKRRVKKRKTNVRKLIRKIMKGK